MAPPLSCQECGAPEARLRRCTRERLCEACRVAPQYRILSEAQVLRSAPLTRTDLEALVLGTRSNARNPRFSRERIYRWLDVLLLLQRFGLHVPPELE